MGSSGRTACGVEWMHAKRDNNGWEVLSIDEALSTLEQVAEKPSVENLICLLQKCRKEKNIVNAKHVHMYIRNNGLETHRVLGNYLVPMFVHCGSLCDAQKVFDRLVDRNECSWTSLMQGYIEHGESRHALNLFQKMKEDCVHPNTYTFVVLLRACTRLQDMERGQEICMEIVKQGFERDLIVGTTLVDMYAKFGSLVEAHEVLDKLPIRNVVSWTALIAGYGGRRLGEEALKCLDQMQMDGVFPNVVTFVCSLKACSCIGAMERGREIHAKIAKEGIERNPFVGSTLVDMYAKFGTLAEAWEVFDDLPIQGVVSWNALIAGYAEYGLGKEALGCLQQMRLEGMSPDGVTFVLSLKACGSIRAIDKGLQIHAEIALQGLEGDHFVGSALMDMYVKCGLLAEAREVFDKLPIRNVVLWTALIVGNAENGHCNEALNYLKQMQLENVFPDAVTFVCGLKACGIIRAVEKGQEIHAEIVKQGLEGRASLGNMVVDMYCKCGLLAEACEVFDQLPIRDVALWTSIITGSVECGLGEEAMNWLEWMQLEGVSPDAVTFVSSLKASSSIGAIDKGRKIHHEVAKEGFEIDPFVGNMLVDMYAKCGSHGEAWDVFCKLLVQSIFSWTALIIGFAHQGESELVFHLFERMEEEGIQPDGTVFLSVLNVCSHVGLVEKCHKYFEAMSQDYCIILTIEHYNCMIDLLSRVGQLDEAVAVLEIMPFQPNLVTWSTILGACQKWGDVDLGRWAFEGAKELGERYDATFISMINIYADAHMWEDMREIESLRMVTCEGNTCLDTR